MEPIIPYKILKIKDEKVQSLEDLLAVESKIKIFINNEEIISLSATPIQIKELIVGFLLTENIVKGSWCPEEIEIIEKGEEIEVRLETEGTLDLTGKTLTSGCLSSVSFMKDLPERYEDDFKIKLERLFFLFKEFQKKSELYKSTGCIHYAGLADSEKIIFLGEDVGRHNAVDKVIGYALLNGIPLKNKILLVSGRISSEMVLKAARWKVPVIVSRSAPTSLAIEIAKNTGLTIIGFLRGNRCNIYTHAQRIDLKGG